MGTNRTNYSNHMKISEIGYICKGKKVALLLK